MSTEFDYIQQDSYSRGELLLRSFFGWFYILIPHGFILFFIGIWSAILTFVAFWSILFTGRYPISFFEFQEKALKWSYRVSGSIWNFFDGYPEFGLESENPNLILEIEYPENLDRGHALVKALFGWLYCGIPHVFVWYFRLLATFILMFLAWWSVLFTGQYPESWYRFNVGTMRWMFRVNLYLKFMTDDYPPFSGRPSEDLDNHFPDPEADIVNPIT